MSSHRTTPGAPKVYKLEKKWQRANKERKKYRCEEEFRELALQASNPDRITSRCKCEWERASEKNTLCSGIASD